MKKLSTENRSANPQHNLAREFNLPLAKIKSVHKVLSLRELLGT